MRRSGRWLIAWMRTSDLARPADAFDPLRLHSSFAARQEIVRTVEAGWLERRQVEGLFDVVVVLPPSEAAPLGRLNQRLLRCPSPA